MSEGFAAVPTWMIREKSVPRNAILVYASLSSRAGYGAIFPSQVTIAKESGLSERTVRTMLGRLEDLGVIERSSRRGGEGRANTKTDAYLLRPNGRVKEPASFAGRSEQPANTDRATGNERQTTPYIDIDKEEIDNTPTFQDLEEMFADAWKHWPKKKERKASLEKFKAKAKSHFAQDPTELVSLIGQFGRAYAATTEPQYVPALCFWLNRERWTDELPALPTMQSDQRMQSNLAVIAELEAQEQGELRA